MAMLHLVMVLFCISLIGIVLIPSVFAEDSYYVYIPPGTGVPGCENTNSCYDYFHTIVGVGDTVTWENADSALHTVTSGYAEDGFDGIFDSSLLEQGETFTYRFDHDGFYPYFCAIHPWMTGIIEVEDFGFVDLTWDGFFFGTFDYRGNPIVPFVGEEFELRLDLDNIGNSDSSFVQYAVDIYDEFGNQVFSEERTINSILAYNGFSIAWYPMINSPGEYTAEFYIDYNDYIFESNENNNYFEAQIFVQGVYRPYPPELFFDKQEYTAGETMVVTVIDDVANKYSNAIDEVEVGLESIPTGDISWTFIDETGRDTAIFSITTTVPDIPYDTEVRVWYPYEVGDGSIASLTATVFVYAAGGGNTAALQTDKSSYIIGTDAIITLIEPDEDVSSSVDLINANNILVYYKGKQTTILDPAFDASDSWLRETDRQTGIFQIIVKIPNNIGNTTLQDGDIIEFQYIDDTTNSGSTETIRTTIQLIDFTQPPPPPPSDADIIIPQGTSVPGCEVTNSCFSPSTIFADVGETIKWYNADTAAHTVTSGTPRDGPDGWFDSNILMSGSTFSVTFSQAGTYDYFDMTSPWMLGVVIVEGSSGTGISDNVPPLLLMPKNMVVDATDSRGISVDFSVKAIDDVDGVISPRCSPHSGSQFPIGDNLVTCSATDRAGNSDQKSFTITVRSPDIVIPNWVRDVAEFWCGDEIDDPSFIGAIQYLIDNDVILVPVTGSGVGYSQEVPAWVKNNACWWSQGLITDKDFASGIQYLIGQGIIRV